MTEKASVLIIEDDATMLRGLSDNFRQRGYSVQTASDGDAGLAAALTGSPDVVILDIMLPGTNGFEICSRLRQRKCDSAIIMLTAKGQEDDVVRGLELGADDYVTKPFSIRELIARVEAFLRRTAEETSTEYRFGTFRLDRVGHKLFRGEEEVVLTGKEFRLLEYFLLRAGRALTRRDILAGVWGSRVIVTTRSVDRCVTTLRGKIESDSRHPAFIKTVRDVGYRFETDPD